MSDSVIDVFICSGNAEREGALSLRAALLGMGVRVFSHHADLTPGDRWDEVIEEALSRSRLVAVLVSGAWRHERMSRAPEEVARALESLAGDDRVRVVPLLMRSLIDRNLPYGLRRLVGIPRADEDWQRTAAALERALGGRERLGGTMVTLGAMAREAAVLASGEYEAAAGSPSSGPWPVAVGMAAGRAPPGDPRGSDWPVMPAPGVRASGSHGLAGQGPGRHGSGSHGSGSHVRAGQGSGIHGSGSHVRAGQGPGIHGSGSHVRAEGQALASHAPTEIRSALGRDVRRGSPRWRWVGGGMFVVGVAVAAAYAEQQGLFGSWPGVAPRPDAAAVGAPREAVMSAPRGVGAASPVEGRGAIGAAPASGAPTKVAGAARAAGIPPPVAAAGSAARGPVGAAPPANAAPAPVAGVGSAARGPVGAVPPANAAPPPAEVVAGAPPGAVALTPAESGAPAPGGAVAGAPREDVDRPSPAARGGPARVMRPIRPPGAHLGAPVVAARPRGVRVPSPRTADAPPAVSGAPTDAAAPPGEMALAVLEVRASSTSRRRYGTGNTRRAFGPKQLVDGDPTTAWQAGGEREGARPWVEFDLGDGAVVSGFEITNGLPASDPDLGDLFGLNGRLRRVSVFADGEKVVERRVPDGREPRKFTFPPVRARALRLVIERGEPGTKWGAVTIAEVRLFGRRPE